MAGSVISTFPAVWTFEDVLRQLGDIPARRIHAVPALGLATEEDLLAAEARTGRICELIDGALVEKPVGYLESMLAAVLINAISQFLKQRNLGIVLGADGPFRILPGQVRVPDVAFVSWARFPSGKLPSQAILGMAPDLAVEVLSEGNTAREMARKLEEFFRAGTRLVWHVDGRTRTVEVYASPLARRTLAESDVLDGGDVLPGFELSVRELFANLPGAAS